MKHSEYGLMSFVLFLAGLAVFLGWSIINGTIASHYSENQVVPVFFLVIVEGWFLLLTEPFLILSAMGICLAVTGLFQSGRKKKFAVLGFLLNGIALVVSIVLVIYSRSVIK